MIEMFNYNKIVFGVLFVICFSVQNSWGYFTSCDLKYNLAAGQSITLKSPSSNFNWNATEKAYSCRYLVTAPPGYTITINCSLYMNCANSMEYLYISRDALYTMDDKKSYCGYGTVTDTSLFNSIIFAYISQYTDSPNYLKYSCQLTASTTQTCDCGWNVNTKIVNGIVTQPNEIISMAGLVSVSGKFVFCGGAIIHYRHILSAAHCFTTYNNAADTAILVGDQDYNIGSDTIYSALYKVLQFIIHPSYSKTTNANDIALVKTVDNIQWHRGVGPACLPFNTNELFAGKIVTAAGWGSIEYGGPISTTLRKVNLNVITNSVCSNTYVITANQMCTYTPYKDTCQYDSGGNLYYINSQVKLFTVGIVSYGSGCASVSPSVNTRVTQYISWIGTVLNIPSTECYPTYAL